MTSNIQPAGVSLPLASAFSQEGAGSAPVPADWLMAIKGEHFTTEIAPGIMLHVLPGVQICWDEFVATAPRFSIGLDGFVRGAPRIDPSGPFANYNHHEDVNRSATRSTEMQIFMAIKEQTLELFRDNGAPKIHIFVNDPDQDTALAVWLLANQERCAPYRSEPLLNALVTMEDLLDTSGGTYPVNPTDPLMRKLAWVFEPYVLARQDKRIGQMQGNEMANVIASVSKRISDYSIGLGREIPLDTRLEILGNYDGWSMIKPIGFYALTELRRRGITAFASYGGELEGGRHKWTVGKLTDANPFPLVKFTGFLNRIEGIREESEPHWGGGDRYIGSPRSGDKHHNGSALSPQEFVKATQEFLELHRQGQL